MLFKVKLGTILKFNLNSQVQNFDFFFSCNEHERKGIIFCFFILNVKERRAWGRKKSITQEDSRRKSSKVAK